MMTNTRKIDPIEVYRRRAAEAAAPHPVEPGAAAERPRRPRTIADLVDEYYGGPEDTP
jgi:hypothetical protein